MRGTLIVMMVAALVFGVLAVAGCGRARPIARACAHRVLTGFLPFIYRHPLSSSTETLLLTSQAE